MVQMLIKLFLGKLIKLRESGSPGIINVGTCNLHVVHNSFSKELIIWSTDR